MTPEQRAVAISAIIGNKTLTYAYKGVTFQLSGITLSGDTVWATVSAWTGTGASKVFLPVDNPYGFKNPPLMTQSGTQQVVIGGVTYTVPAFVRDDLTAAKEIVYQTVTQVARSHGWVG